MAKQQGTGGGKPAKPGKPGKKPKLSRAERREASRARRAQLRQVFSTTRRLDPRGFYLTLAIFAVPLIAGILVGILVTGPLFFPIIGLLVGVLAGMSFFGRRAQAAMFSEVEGQAGYAPNIVSRMRNWIITPGVAVSRSQDMLHRAIGRPGVVLIAEGPSINAQKNLISEEARKIRRFSPNTGITSVHVGPGEGQVPLRRLQAHLLKLPKVMNMGEAAALDKRLKALDKERGILPIPKGPVPTRVPRKMR